MNWKFSTDSDGVAHQTIQVGTEGAEVAIHTSGFVRDVMDARPYDDGSTPTQSYYTFRPCYQPTGPEGDHFPLGEFNSRDDAMAEAEAFIRRISATG